MKDQLEDIKMIREMMEKSTKFLSLSGLSGIIAGVAAIAGAAFAWFYLLKNPAATDFSQAHEIMILVLDAVLVLLISISAAIYFSWKKAKKIKQSIFNKTSLRILYNLAIPLVAGGIFSIIFLNKGQIEIVVSATLLFYGLALVNVSKYTFKEIHYLGITEIILGLLAAYFLNKGIIFWTIGFGICHIIYGIIMYRKYDLKK